MHEGVEEGRQTLHLLRVVVTVDGVQFEPHEGLVGVVRSSLGHHLVSLQHPVELPSRLVEQWGEVVHQPDRDEISDTDMTLSLTLTLTLTLSLTYLDIVSAVMAVDLRLVRRVTKGILSLSVTDRAAARPLQLPPAISRTNRNCNITSSAAVRDCFDKVRPRVRPK